MSYWQLYLILEGPGTTAAVTYPWLSTNGVDAPYVLDPVTNPCFIIANPSKFGLCLWIHSH